ncbi:MAG: OmpA family protein [Chitinophagales bacterium]|nr:OmpA family protein [Chitinophagales bacterium]
MKKIFTLLLVASLSLAAIAQNESHKWAVGAGISATDFSGPITKSYFDFDNYKGSGRIFVGRYINPSFNAKLDFTFGKVWFPTITAYPDVVADVYQLKHIYDAGINIEYKFNNGYIFKESAVVAPYIHTGFGFNSIVDYDVNTYVPFGIGLNIRPADWLTINIQSTYKLNIDNSYDYTQHSASLVYNFGKGKKEAKSEDTEVSDSDSDGVPDLIDECPFAAGTAEFFGCPDSDGDGLGDSRDNCPQEAGSMDNKGCPMADSDGDGVPDDKDSCPNEKGDKRYAGCPDTDGDGIVDKYDKCPELAGVASNNGCPKEAVETVSVPTVPSTPTVSTPVVTSPSSSNLVGTGTGTNSVFFASGSDLVSASEKKKIDQVLAILEANPNYKVKIKGYTDEAGDEYSNVNLSLRRAQNVWKYMSEKGFNGSRAELYGYGEYFQQSPKLSENRRVDIEIIK